MQCDNQEFVPFRVFCLQKAKISFPLVSNHFSTCKATNWNDHGRLSRLKPKKFTINKLKNFAGLDRVSKGMAICSWRSRGIKSATPESELRTGTSKTKQLNSSFLMFQCTVCFPVWRFFVPCDRSVVAKGL